MILLQARFMDRIRELPYDFDESVAIQGVSAGCTLPIPG